MAKMPTANIELNVTCPRCAALDKVVEEVNNIVRAKRYRKEFFKDDTEFADWTQSRLRAALAAIRGKREGG